MPKFTIGDRVQRNWISHGQASNSGTVVGIGPEACNGADVRWDDGSRAVYPGQLLERVEKPPLRWSDQQIAQYVDAPLPLPMDVSQYVKKLLGWLEEGPSAVAAAPEYRHPHARPPPIEVGLDDPTGEMMLADAPGFDERRRGR